MRPSHRSLLAAVCTACAACATAPPPPPVAAAPAAAVVKPPKPQAAAGLRLVVTPPDAEVNIDGVARGTAAALAARTGGLVALPAGVHRVSVRRDGYQTWRAEVAVGRAVERIEIRLVEKR